MISLRPAYDPQIGPRLSRPKVVGGSRLARALARRHGGDGDLHLRRLMRIAASDRDPRSQSALRALLAVMGRC